MWKFCLSVGICLLFQANYFVRGQTLATLPADSALYARYELLIIDVFNLADPAMNEVLLGVCACYEETGSVTDVDFFIGLMTIGDVGYLCDQEFAESRLELVFKYYNQWECGDVICTGEDDEEDDGEEDGEADDDGGCTIPGADLCKCGPVFSEDISLLAANIGTIINNSGDCTPLPEDALEDDGLGDGEAEDGVVVLVTGDDEEEDD